MNQKTRHEDIIDKVLNGILQLKTPFTMVELGKETGLSMKETRSVLVRLVVLGILKPRRTGHGSYEYYVINEHYLKQGYQPTKGIW